MMMVFKSEPSGFADKIRPPPRSRKKRRPEGAWKWVVWNLVLKQLRTLVYSPFSRYDFTYRLRFADVLSLEAPQMNALKPVIAFPTIRFCI